MTAPITLDVDDAIELAELLTFLWDWLGTPHAAASYDRFTFRLLTVNELHADLARFTFILTGHHLPDTTDQ